MYHIGWFLFSRLFHHWTLFRDCSVFVIWFGVLYLTVFVRVSAFPRLRFHIHVEPTLHFPTCQQAAENCRKFLALEWCKVEKVGSWLTEVGKFWETGRKGTFVTISRVGWFSFCTITVDLVDTLISRHKVPLQVPIFAVLTLSVPIVEVGEYPFERGPVLLTACSLSSSHWKHCQKKARIIFPRVKSPKYWPESCRIDEWVRLWAVNLRCHCS